MIQLAIIIVIIISLVAGLYSIILLGRMRKRYKLDYLNSFFYFQILYFLFGLYGILGNLAVQQILLKFAIEKSIIGSVALFFPFLGVPLIIAAWYLSIKLSAELINKKVHQFVAIGYFILATCVFLVFGSYMQKMPDIDYQTFSKQVILVFCLIDLVVASYFSLILSIQSINVKIKSKQNYLLRFGIITQVIALFRVGSLYFSDYHLIVGLYFFLIFFAGNLAGILLTKVYLFNHGEEQITSLIDTGDMYLKFGISNREKEIIQEICKGKTNQQIADELFISLQTVKDHTYNIFRKVNVKNRVQLAKIFQH